MLKKIKKILKWTGLVLLFIILGVTATTAFRQNLKYEAPYPEVHASKDSAIIERGKQLVFGPGHCTDCHSTVNTDSMFALGLDVPLIGGHKFELPIGNIYSRNITPDKETGIGRYTDPELARALRYGVRPNGTAMFDFMPFHNTSDEDLTAIISYLRAQKPVRNEVPEHDFNPIGMVIKAFLLKPVGPDGEVLKSVKRDSTAEYGKYLANSVANCGGCHTNRDLMTGAFIGEPYAGGPTFETPGKVPLTPPNLTTDSSSRIFGWTQQNFIDRVRMGKLIDHSHMPWNSYKRMSDEDLKAIYKYLKTLKPVNTTVKPK